MILTLAVVCVGLFPLLSEYRQLQGDWILVEASDLQGKMHKLKPRSAAGQLVWTIRGNRLRIDKMDLSQEKELARSLIVGDRKQSVVSRGGQSENVFTINPFTSPKCMDGVFDPFSSLVPAIYQLDGNRLRIAIPVDFSLLDATKPTRPSTFAIDASSDFFVMVFRRVEKPKHKIR